MIAPERIPKEAAKAPKTKIKAAARNCNGRRPLCFLQRNHRSPNFPETARPGETEGQSAPPASMRLRTPFPEAPPPGIFSR